MNKRPKKKKVFRQFFLVLDICINAGLESGKVLPEAPGLFANGDEANVSSGA